MSERDNRGHWLPGHSGNPHGRPRNRETLTVHLRRLAERPDLTPEIWESLLDADPPFFEEAEQMRLL